MLAGKQNRCVWGSPAKWMGGWVVGSQDFMDGRLRGLHPHPIPKPLNGWIFSKVTIVSWGNPREAHRDIPVPVSRHRGMWWFTSCLWLRCTLAEVLEKSWMDLPTKWTRSNIFMLLTFLSSTVWPICIVFFGNQVSFASGRPHLFNPRFPVNWGGFSGQTGREGMLPQVYMKIDVESSTIDCLESLVASQSEGHWKFGLADPPWKTNQGWHLRRKAVFSFRLNSIFQPLSFFFSDAIFIFRSETTGASVTSCWHGERRNVKEPQETYSSMCCFWKPRLLGAISTNLAVVFLIFYQNISTHRWFWEGIPLMVQKFRRSPIWGFMVWYFIPLFTCGFW